MDTYYERNKEHAKEVALSYYWKHRDERREWFKKYYIDVLKPRRQEDRMKRNLEREEQKKKEQEERKKKKTKRVVVVQNIEEPKIETKNVYKSNIRISYEPVILSFD
jgi:hypothetical protein